MNKQEQLKKVNSKIASILEQMEDETDVGKLLDLHSMFTLYMDRRQELKKQLEQ